MFFTLGIVETTTALNWILRNRGKKGSCKYVVQFPWSAEVKVDNNLFLTLLY